jgi:Holliday junction DNA helicase RuvA
VIGRLYGKLLTKQPPQLLIDVSGVAYEVEAPMSTFYRLPELNDTVTLHTHLVVREDCHLLYGFYELRERSLFRTLIKVNGVGPKLALTILSSIEPDDFVSCIHSEDAQSLTRLPGIGKKTAERLVIEMRDRLSDWNPVTLPCVEGASQFAQDAVSALVALGYKPNDASRAVKQVAKPGMSSQDIIRLSLQGMIA